MAQDVVREKNDKAKIQENLSIIKGENVTLARQLKSLNNRKAVLERKLQDLQEGKTAVEQRLEEMEVRLADRASQVGSLKKDIDLIKKRQPVPVSNNKKPEVKETVELPAIVVRSLSSPGEKGKADQAGSSGKVLAVNSDSNFVVIDLGSSVGVKVGDTFTVYRDGKPVGSIEVIQARGNISACDIRRKDTALRIGDIVK